MSSNVSHLLIKATMDSFVYHISKMNLTSGSFRYAANCGKLPKFPCPPGLFFVKAEAF